MAQIGTVIKAAIDYFDGDVRRINHLLKVYGYSKTLGELEGLDERTLEILDTTSVLHDIGIKISEQKYNSSAGKYQEIEGPAVAENILRVIGGYDEEFIERVKFLIGHHHTYDSIDGIDYQILVEADFLVNADEDGLSKEAVKAFADKIFKTASGLSILNSNYIREV